MGSRRHALEGVRVLAKPLGYRGKDAKPQPLFAEPMWTGVRRIDLATVPSASCRPQATSDWISRRSSLILRIARASPAWVDPSSYS